MQNRVLTSQQSDYLASVADQVEAYIAKCVRVSGLPLAVHDDAVDEAVYGFCRRFAVLPVDCGTIPCADEKLAPIVRQSCRRAVQSAVKKIAIAFHRDCNAMNLAVDLSRANAVADHATTIESILVESAAVMQWETDGGF